ncbi:MAG: alpha-N-arabinofuranosidase [Armatimonadetes bacterium]|nr:alpha-N-arabinofuranosidase [Armatimonadota bacterium]
MTARLRVLQDEIHGRISPRLYGHFAEHLGRCCYDGLFVGKNSSIPNIEGFRKDVVEALRDMPTPMLRWPGGCYADHYHWKDGIGADRPIRLGMSCGLQVLDTNELGTDEFLTLCALIGAEPYLAGNMGSGSPEELCHWIEYCNTALPTALAQQRRANGQDEPYGVKLWGIGNENWGCGGNYDAESYALEYRRYSLMAQHVDPTIEMVCCGHDTDWNRRCIDKLRNHMNFVDHYSIHRYWINGGHGTDFSEEEYYALLDEADKTEDFIIETRQFLDEASGGRRHVGIALDEWGVWHSEARNWGPGGSATESNDYTQPCTMRDAVATAIGFEVFHRQSSSLSMANLAQIVNVLHAPIMTDGEAMWLTPTYHVLHLNQGHIGGDAYRVEVEGGPMLPNGTPAISATATMAMMTLVNRHMTETIEVEIPALYCMGQVLAADQPNAQNSATEKPVRLETLPGTVDGDVVRVVLPPCSVATQHRPFCKHTWKRSFPSSKITRLDKNAR